LDSTDLSHLLEPPQINLSFYRRNAVAEVVLVDVVRLLLNFHNLDNELLLANFSPMNDRERVYRVKQEEFQTFWEQVNNWSLLSIIAIQSYDGETYPYELALARPWEAYKEGVITISCSAPEFQGIVSQNIKTVEKKQYQKGMWSYNIFKKVVTDIDITYASIGVESVIEIPEELKNNSLSYSLTDFYVSYLHFESKIVERVLKIFAGAYIEHFDNGVYISTSKWFNPSRIGMERLLAVEKSIIATTILSNALLK